MIVLDTNVISELMRPAPSPAVRRWVAQQSAGDLWTTAISQGELLFGVASLPAGRRRSALTAAVEAILMIDMRGKILPFDSAAARHYGELLAERRRAGRLIALQDGMIAAICQAQGCRLATRNVADFAGCGLELLDPWR